MAGSRLLKIEILGDAKDAAKAFGTAGGAADGFGKKMSGAAKVGGAALLGIGLGAIAIVPDLLSAGAELDALGKKASTVFGDSLGQVQGWAKENAAAMGLTKAEAVGAAASIGDLLKPMGFGAEAAATMATDMLDLSGALSAWTGGTISATEVSGIITKAMLGETDGLKALGISISAADIKARLLAKGQDKLTGAALEQAEALAIQELIMEKSTDAQTAWNDGSMDGIKAQNESKASIEQLKESFTQALYPALTAILPVVQEVTAWLGEHMGPAMDLVGGIVKTVFEGGKHLVEGLASAFGTNEGVILGVLGGIAAALGLVAIAWNAGPGIIITGVVLIVGSLIYAYEKVDWFRAAVDGAFKLIGAIVQTGIDIFKEIWHTVLEPLGAFLGAAFKLHWNIAETAIGLAKDAVVIAIAVFKDIWNNVLVPLGAFLSGPLSVAWGAAKVAIDIAKGAVDIMFTAAKGLWDNVLSPVAGFLSGAFSLAWSTAGTAIGLVKGIFDTVASVVRDLWLNVMIPVGTFLGAAFKTGWEAAGTAIGLVKTAFDNVVTVAKALWHDVLEPVVNFFEGAFKTGIGIAKGAIDTLKAPFEAVIGFIQKIIDKANEAIDVISNINPFDTEGPGVVVVSSSQHPPGGPPPSPWGPGGKSHSGGIIPGRGNEEVIRILQAGEAVFTRDQQVALGGMLGGRGGAPAIYVTNVIHGSVVTQQDLNRNVADGLIDMVRRGIIPPGAFN